jgi:hypothetical protein
MSKGSPEWGGMAGRFAITYEQQDELQEWNFVAVGINIGRTFEPAAVYNDQCYKQARKARI